MRIISDGQMVDLLVRECGMKGDADFEDAASTLWSLYSDEGAQFGAGVRYLSAKLHALSFLCGRFVTSTDTEELDIVEKDSQKFANALKLYQATADLLDKRLETAMGAEAVPSEVYIAEIAQKTPIPYCYGSELRNPNLLKYRGLPQTGYEEWYRGSG